MKRALIVGINYVGTGNDLKGCINDAHNMEAELKARNFDEIKLLLEKDATTANMKAQLQWLVAGAVPGDVLVFHYSGHGSQLPSKVEADGFEEILCPIDLNWTTRVITDDFLRQTFSSVPNGVNVTLVLDCCHSGTALDQDQSLVIATKDITPAAGTEPAGSRFLPPPDKIAAKLADRELVNWSTERDVNQSALLIAGCKAEQTSADAYIDGVCQGAATYALLKALKGGEKSYRDIVTSMNLFMIKNGYSQRPELDGFPGLYDEFFAEPFGAAAEAAMATAPAPAAPAPVVDAAPAAAEGSSKKSTIIMIAVVLAMIAFVIFS